jgi:hypothetical protein
MGNGIQKLSLVCAMSILTTGCFWEDSSTANANRNAKLPDSPEGATLNILTQWPQDEQRQIDTKTSMSIRFDGPINADSLLDGLTYVEERNTLERVACKLSLEDNYRTLIIDPVEDLDLETYYVCHLSPLLNDLNQRLLEEDLFFTFETKDATAPQNTATSINNGAHNVARDGLITAYFDETIDPASVTSTAVSLVRNSNNKSHSVQCHASGSEVRCQPIQDLLPITSYTLTIRGGDNGLMDLSGNRLATTTSISFTTSEDIHHPSLISYYPSDLYASPNAQILLTFDESMDPDSIHIDTFSFANEIGDSVAFDVIHAADGKNLSLVPHQPLSTNQNYSVVITDGASAIKDLSGRPIQNAGIVRLLIGSDTQAPALTNSTPTNGASRVCYNVTPILFFDQGLDIKRVNSDTFSLTGPEGPIDFLLTASNGNTKVILTPTDPLANGQKFTVTVKSGPMGIRDTVGNLLHNDITVEFTTGLDRTLPLITVSPTHGHSAVSTIASFTAVFDEPLDPATVTAETVIVTDRSDQVVAGTIYLTNNNRIITFDATHPYLPGEWYTVTLRNGGDGIREDSGNWLPEPVRTTFRIAYTEDITPPEVAVTINATNSERKEGMSVARSGFEINVVAEDPINYDLDLGSFDITITGPAETPSSEQVLNAATVTKEGLQFVITTQNKLDPGDYSVQARVADIAGNYGQSEILSFSVVDFDASVMPFEHTEVVWVRFDMDRSGNGRPDFEDDLIHLGLITENDPLGTNQRMIDIMREGILSQAHRLFERKANGGRHGADSIALMMTATQPRGVLYSQMSLGGMDPNGLPNRIFGDKSTGILGRAYYDGKNANRTDNNTVTNPGLGIFSGELFLFEVQTHETLYPHFLTRFAKRFIKTVPQMGGTPVGTDAIDPIIMARNFDLTTANLQQLRRYLDILYAADDWATATGVILAHEIGHSIGLVATGTPPQGLHGDNSLHNMRPNLGDIMSSAVSYDSVVSLDYHFRDINIAYLRQRLLLK